jgi:alkyl sulfatase BDS1-like metallo-beta-lactamase superfamily hydrolase
MNTEIIDRRRQRGAVGKTTAVVLAVVAVVGLWLALTGDVKKQAELKALDVIGDAAVQRLSVGTDGEGSHGSSVELIKRPIEVRQIADNIHYATGVGNVMMITTDEGNVIFDTGLVIQTAKQLAALKAVSEAPVRYVVLSHSHADHIGGTRYWAEEGTEIIAHERFEEEQRYLAELEPYQYGRNRALFPWMPSWEDRPDIAMMRYGGIEPTLTVGDWQRHKFELGGVQFEVIGTPGAEGADNAVLWLPQQKVLFTGDFFGPQFPQFPNIFTMRGEKVRAPAEYLRSLQLLMELQPEIVVPSHFNPTEGAEEIYANMQRIHDAVAYVHDATVAGMNAGKTVYELMREIQLPPHLDLVQNHGKVDWAVRSIWEYYATWFHFDSTTELYPVPAREVYADLAEVAGSEGLVALGQNYLQQNKPVKVLHVMEVVLAAQPENASALRLQLQALQSLLQAAENGLRNDYEIYWLQGQIAQTQALLAPDA